MHYNFCTLFDSNYLTRGLAMYNSLSRVCSSFTLYIFAFDDRVYEILRARNLKNAVIISLKEFEDTELLKVKPTRSIAEYCWTSTSSTVLYVLENFDADNCTYIDADLYFYSSPAPLFEEMGSRSILLTEHRYSPQYNKEVKSGKYCVQFVTFKKDEQGLKALRWWRERCLEWCYAYYEDGKFGDQLYLDDWTTRFDGVHELQHKGGGLAAWNVQQYSFSNKEGKLTGTVTSTGEQFDVVFYHFHYLRFFTNGEVELGRRTLTPEVLDLFYKPYIKELLALKDEISKEYPGFDPNGAGMKPAGLKASIITVYRKLKKVYNIFEINKFLSR